MASPYQYCSRCGEELPENVTEMYEQEHEGGPVLCVPCIREVLHGIPKAIQSVYEVFADAFEEAFGELLATNQDKEE